MKRLIFVVCLLLGTLIAGQSAGLPANQDNIDGSVELTTDKSTYELGEPVVMTFTNVGREVLSWEFFSGKKVVYIKDACSGEEVVNTTHSKIVEGLGSFYPGE